MNFLLFLISLNFILFLPIYLLGIKKRWNPLDFILNGGSLETIIRHLAISKVMDPFRFSFEYSLAAITLITFDINHPIALFILSLIATFSLVFNTYAGIMLNVFKKTPIVKIDLSMLYNSRGLYKGYLWLIFLAFSILVCGFIYLFYVAHLYVWTLPSNHFLNAVLVAYILFVGLFHLYKDKMKDYQYRTVVSTIVYFRKSNAYSNQYKHLLKSSIEEIKNLNHYTQVSLSKRPNIHIISMESYGSVIYTDKEKYQNVVETIKEWDTKFGASDIQVCTSFSVPPVFAQGTWYSYSTLLFGLEIENDVRYNTLFKNMVNFDHYESLLRYTRRQGYHNYLLHGLIGDFDHVIDFVQMEKVLTYDTLFYNKELEYKGQKLNYMKVQDCHPDQYTLNKGLEMIRSRKNPYTMFYCTLNSHWDFHSPMKLAENWKDLNEPSHTFETNKDTSMDRFQQYGKSIQYGLNNVFDLITRKAESNDIFIVYGDHQPTTLTELSQGKDTQIHIFSKNKAFVDEWEKFGFNKGLIPRAQDEHFKLEAFYSAFMICLNKVYGENPDLELPFNKYGLDFLWK